MGKALSEYAAVEAAVSKLGEANVVCNFDLCRSIFHEKAGIVGLVEGEVVPGGVKELDAAISGQGPLPNFRNRMDILALDDNIAVVRVPEEEVVGNNYVNYLILMKSRGEWKCVSMAYAQS